MYKIMFHRSEHFEDMFSWTLFKVSFELEPLVFSFLQNALRIFSLEGKYLRGSNTVFM